MNILSAYIVCERFFLTQHGKTIFGGGNLSSEILNICPRESAEQHKSFRMLKYAGCLDVPKKRNSCAPLFIFCIS